MTQTPPDATKHNPDASYIRGLITRAGLTQAEAAAIIGRSVRVIGYWVSDSDPRRASYVDQYTLEHLPRQAQKNKHIGSDFDDYLAEQTP